MATIRNAAAWARRENERAARAADRRILRWIIITLVIIAPLAVALYLLVR